MARVKIAAVSYLNTIPFIYGIEQSGKFPDADLLLSPPAGCAGAMASGIADIALMPVAEIPNIDDINIAGSYCIGARGVVRTVVLMSASPFEKITEIYLDPHSRTSAALVKVLARELWHIEPRWLPLEDYSTVVPCEGVGYMLIGDKVFGYENIFAHSCDLASEWQRLTGLPFVFAAWVARKGIEPGVLAKLEAALEYGVAHIPQAVDRYSKTDRPTAISYLTQNIDFNFDALKRRAMELFLGKIR